jgi:hypothetical protein
MEIKEFANGKFQIWDGNMVLDPNRLKWENDYQSQHDFMFFRSIKQAKQAILDVSNKEKCVAVHKVEITEVKHLK